MGPPLQYINTQLLSCHNSIQQLKSGQDIDIDEAEMFDRGLGAMYPLVDVKRKGNGRLPPFAE